jgi:hypothetical protein
VHFADEHIAYQSGRFETNQWLLHEEVAESSHAPQLRSAAQISILPIKPSRCERPRFRDQGGRPFLPLISHLPSTRGRGLSGRD